VTPDAMAEEKAVFSTYLQEHRLKRSEQREVILDTFLRSDRHLSVDELLRLVQKKRPEVGRTTVYRSLKLFQAAGLAQELHLDGQARFERDYKRAHHDHFFCRACGEIFEFASAEIERLQEEIAAGLGFQIEGHRHLIHGLCGKCAGNEASTKGRPAG